MPDARAIVVSDPHLGASGEQVEREFHAFLAEVPQSGDDLLINGDLFDFWFEYRRVIPRRPFRTLVALREARERGVSIAIVGGNHDRWGGTFFSEELDIPFHGTGHAEVVLAGRPTYVHHGDGIAEQHWSSRLLHRVTRHAATVALFRALHPDVGFWIADRLSGTLADSTKEDAVLERAARAQEQWAAALLARRADVDLVVLGHTHHPALVRFARGTYLNPGAFLDEGRYAIVTPEGITLERFSG